MAHTINTLSNQPPQHEEEPVHLHKAYPIATGLAGLAMMGLALHVNAHKDDYRDDLRAAQNTSRQVEHLSATANHDQQELKTLKHPTVARMKYVNGEWQRLDSLKQTEHEQWVQVRKDEALGGVAALSLLTTIGAAALTKRDVKRAKRAHENGREVKIK